MRNSGNSASKKLLTRRSFINTTAAGSAFIAMGPISGYFMENPVQAASWPADASKFRFHMIGHGHIDPVWLWSWEEGVAVVHSTFRSALDRMNETPGFCFTTSSAQFFKWVAENDPGMLAEIKQRVKEGRWNIVGGWWVEPDMNIPSGEAMVRQGLYGQLTFERLLGKRAVVATNPDSFGHTGNLPQIIAKQGMENYIFMRPGVREKTIPSDLFWWEGPDGTKVLTYRIQQSYNDGGHVRNRLNTVMNQSAGQPMKTYMAYYGVGDHGGGATKETIKSVTDVMAEKGAPKTFFSTADNYFTEVRNDKSLKLPVIKDDLQHHAVGCYTAESEIKKSNRRCEAELVTAEKIAAIGSMVWGAVYPKKELTSAWERLLFLQFHDSLAGSSLYDHSQAAREGYGYSLDIAHQATWMAMQKLEWQVPAEDPASQYMIIFNPHAWEVKANIEYDFNWGSNHKSSRVEDEKGNHLPHQWTAGSSETGSRRKLIVNAAIPPMGYRQLRLLDGDSQAFGYNVTAGNNTLENDLIRVTFSEDGSLSIYDKENGKEVFAGGASGCKAVIIDDPSDTWSHDIKTYDREIGAFGKAKIIITESGPLRATLRVITSYGSSQLTTDWMLYAGSRNLEAKVSLDWHEHLKMLKFSFTVDIDSPVATYETSYGHIVRAANGDEDPGQRWIDVTGQKSGKEYGLTVLNDAKYGYSVKGNDMRISVARSAVYAHHNPKVLDMKAEHLWMDQGIQTFRLMLVPHTGNWKKVNIPVIAEEFLTPALALYQGIHGGKLAKSGSFISVESPSVAVTSVKQSEIGDDLIIRCVEMHGNEAIANVKLWFADITWFGKFKPCEIKTLRLKRTTYEINEVNLLEE